MSKLSATPRDAWLYSHKFDTIKSWGRVKVLAEVVSSDHLVLKDDEGYYFKPCFDQVSEGSLCFEPSSGLCGVWHVAAIAPTVLSGYGTQHFVAAVRCRDGCVGLLDAGGAQFIHMRAAHRPFRLWVTASELPQ